MHYNEDWPQAKKRFLAFWQGELVDRCCIAVQAPRKNSHYLPPEPPESQDDLMKWWLDPEDNLKRMVAEFENTFYGGEAFPAATMCLGASVMAGFYGSPAEFRPETVWYHPIIQDWDETHLEFDLLSNSLYRATIDAACYYAKESRDRFMVSLPELGAATDDLSLLRGMQSLLLDMIDRPATVKQAIALLAGTWGKIHNELYQIAAPANDNGCCIAWMQTWAPGPHYQMSCDFSAVLSPKLFREFILPEIQAYLKVNEFSVYHWDGPDAIKHLDALLSIPEIDAIQWTQGEGQAPATDPRWIANYQRIQRAGKKLILPFVEIEEVETLLSQVSSRGLMIRTRASSEEEARALLQKIPGWTRD
ncbi:MAG: hypothetical protein EHM21_14500 [Chloroflexi bacterium]|nr:MAG: hypothetical protein EHM21_14500 [Chloroflexota bacterium]